MSFLYQFVRFSRLHTVIGTTLSILALWGIARALGGAFVSVQYLLWTLGTCLAANIYIVGLNQLVDIDIDRINKPYLPLASGAWSVRTGRTVVLVALALSLLGAALGNGWLLAVVLLSVLLGTLYSLPPVRLKRFPFWAAFCILAVRGLIVNLGLFLNFYTPFQSAPEVPAVVWTLTAVMFVYSILIAFFKDMPDLEGDRRYGISTFSLRLGVRRIHRLGVGLLAGLYLLVAALPFGMDLGVDPWIFSGFHVLLLIALLILSRRVDLTDQQSIARFYQGVWVLFFCEYIGTLLSVIA